MILKSRFFSALFASMMLLTVVLSACSKNEAAQPSSPPPSESASPSASPSPSPSESPSPSPEPEPVELSVFGSIPEDAFATQINQWVTAKYPDYKLNYLCSCILNMPDLKAQKDITPDILYGAAEGDLRVLLGGNLQTDLTGLVDSGIVDLNRFDPASIATAKNFSGGKLYGLPESSNPIALFYNKDVFDKFNAPYPTDGMTWDQLYDLAKQVTGKKDGVNYRGISMFYRFALLGNELSLPIIDAETGKAAVNNDGWKRIFENLSRFYKIPGNLEGYERDSGLELNKFYEQKNIAMVLSLSSSYKRPGFEALNWDMVAAPTFADNNGVGFQSLPTMIYITDTAANKEAALQAVNELLSDEAQLAAAKEGRPTHLLNEQVRQAFGADVPLLQGKNAKAIYYNKFAPSPAVHPTLTLNAPSILAFEFEKVILGELSVQEALVSAESELNKAVEMELANKQ
ncbi:ABC transporter substrate-binding protein [Cohnella phaseoli]|uniref:Multiple sugar transport system substrate-binding protein n=1 Tax=Cohnella phaseoli TaxID=456490 RepID=A0A3D9KLS1_9BACL|nr:extracellular solute-binding protein [Cohnella phaseoli]RED87532.1 multiple sugar transport system substrate-binding protein [Cohnella phaseoli]